MHARRGLESLRDSTRAAEVVRMHDAVRRRLETDWFDEQDLMARPSSAVAAGGQSSQTWGRSSSTCLSDSVRRPLRLLRAVGAASELRIIAASTGVAAADAEVVRSVRDELGALDGSGPAVEPDRA